MLMIANDGPNELLLFVLIAKRRMSLFVMQRAFLVNPQQQRATLFYFWVALSCWF